MSRMQKNTKSKEPKMPKRKIQSKRIVSPKRIKETEDMFKAMAIDGGPSDNAIYRAIGKRLSVSKSTVRNIVLGKGYYK